MSLAVAIALHMQNEMGQEVNQMEKMHLRLHLDKQLRWPHFFFEFLENTRWQTSKAVQNEMSRNWYREKKNTVSFFNIFLLRIHLFFIIYYVHA